MTKEVAVCEPTTRLYYVARMMEERDCGAIPVVQSTDSMKPVGIVTDRDIVIRGIAKNQDALALRAADVMSSGLLCVFPDMSIDECTFKMEEQQVRRAVVVDHTGRCCGIIAQADIARCADERDAAQLVHDVSQPNPQQSSQHYH
jgi:CBS domain-containing protein